MRLLPLFAIMTVVLTTTATAQPRAASVGVQEVEIRALAETVPVFAEVITARDGNIAGRVAGSVETVAVLTGSRVEAGDLLVALNAELLTIQVAQSQAQLAEAEAGIDTANARIDRARIALDRIEALRGGTAFSQGRFDDARADFLEAEALFAEAQARARSAQARVAESRYQLERSEILAPFSGIVLEVNTIPGAFIQAGTPIVRLLDTDAFEVQANVPSRYTAFLEPGQMVQASTETDAALALELRAVLPLENPSTRTRAVLFAAPGLSTMGGAAVGQSLNVQIPIGDARDVLSVPKDALVQGAGGWTVFVAAEDQAQPRAVTLGVPLGDRYEVLSGLSSGDLVVVRGNERLRPGQPIAPELLEAN